MSLQKQITLLVSGLLVSMSLVILLFSVSGANKNFTVERLTALDSSNQEVIKAQAPSNKKGTDLAITLAKARTSFSSTIIFVWLIVIILGTIITYRLVGKSLGSLVKLQKTMSRLDTRNIGKQIEIDPSQPQEVQALSTSYNEMTTRLDESFLKQKNFINNAAHELKTPLAVIITYAQLLQMTADESDQESQKMTDAILSSCDKLSMTLEQLLLLANDNLLQLTDSISTDYIINDVFTELKEQALEKQICLVNKSQKNNQIKGNQVMLGVVVKNLVENAIKYGDEASDVTVMTKVSNDILTVEVRNTGQEIMEDEVESIFDPFYRGQKVSNQIIGNGLGLALVKKIIESHTGEVACTIHGKEICFHFSIPTRQI
ncbi:sensor histidine kinase [Candidatus Enterococcus mansonii]|uniref:histidine kinase n=1 Tax=Candidatus Enterococcus mansonii TaxID=1834181 RepID=A0A242C667_9ENTE|nr:HAMP domain-containing sensor histidine kinase [Enterococcus sp. 4G2_DIV0659]OTO05754.1 hypothetical protein A5880_002929 [Enterococcus sp. 4G2_DIV0659]